MNIMFLNLVTKAGYTPEQVIKSDFEKVSKLLTSAFLGAKYIAENLIDN